MTQFLKTMHDGELCLDHRASPGLPLEYARTIYPEPELAGEGKILRMATVGCPHCGSCQIVNPWRTRERGNCRKCHQYICDQCAIVMAAPDYVHRTFAEVAEMVRSGRYILGDGSTASRPILIPTSIPGV